MKEAMIADALALSYVIFLALIAAIVIWIMTKVQREKGANRKKWLEERVKIFTESYCPNCMYSGIADLAEYVKLCTQMGYKDREIMQMILDLSQSEQPICQDCQENIKSTAGEANMPD